MSGKFIAWGFTLNNYTDQELVSLRNFPEFIRECVWELEEGETGTPHVQGYFRLKTQQRVSYLKNHFLSRAHYVGLGSDEYKENMKKYAQKQDATATSAVTQARQLEPILFPAVIPEMVCEELLEMGYSVHSSGSLLTPEQNLQDFDKAYEIASRRLVTRFRVETLVSRADIRASARLFYREIFSRLQHKRDGVERQETGDDAGGEEDQRTSASEGSVQ